MGRGARDAVFLLPGMGWLVAVLRDPAGIIFVVSLGTRDQYGGRAVRHAGARAYGRALEPDFLPTVGNSLRYAALTTLFSILISYPVAYWISRYGGRRKVLLLVLVMLPFWTSWVIRTYAWMTILGDAGVLNGVLQGLGIIDEPIPILNSDFAVVLGMTYGFLPFAILPLYVSIDRLDPALVAAARDLYADGRAAFLHVTLPLTMPGIVAAATAHVHPRDRRLRDPGPARRGPDDHDRQGHPDAVHVDAGTGRSAPPSSFLLIAGTIVGTLATLRILRREVIG